MTNEQKPMTLTLFNAQPVNQKARSMLEQAGERPDPACLHCVQLALWGIEKADLDAETPLVETVSAMRDWSVERLVNFLLFGYLDAELSPQGWEAVSGPRDLARCILDDIEAKMLHHFPWYSHVE